MVSHIVKLSCHSENIPAPAGPKPCRKNTGRLSAGTVSFSRGPDISGACREKLPYLQYGLLFSSWHIDITSWWNVDSRNCRSTDMGIFRWPGMTPFLYPVAKSMADAAKSGFGDIRCHQMSPDVRILTEKQVVILLKKRMLKQNLIRKNLFLCKHCVTIRIYEDSLFKRTEQVVSLSDKKSFVRQEPTCRLKPGIFLQSRKIQSKGVLMWTWKMERKNYPW